MPEPKKQGVQALNEQVGSRALLVATAAYLVLGVVGFVAAGTLPAASETPEQLMTWFRKWRVRTHVRMGIDCRHPSISNHGRMSATPAPRTASGRFSYRSSLVPDRNPKNCDMDLGGACASRRRSESSNDSHGARCCDLPWASTTGSTTAMMAPVTLLALLGQARSPGWLGILGLVAFLEQAGETILGSPF